MRVSCDEQKKKSIGEEAFRKQEAERKRKKSDKVQQAQANAETASFEAAKVDVEANVQAKKIAFAEKATKLADTRAGKFDYQYCFLLCFAALRLTLFVSISSPDVQKTRDNNAMALQKSRDNAADLGEQVSGIVSSVLGPSVDGMETVQPTVNDDKTVEATSNQTKTAVPTSSDDNTVEMTSNQTKTAVPTDDDDNTVEATSNQPEAGNHTTKEVVAVTQAATNGWVLPITHADDSGQTYPLTYTHNTFFTNTTCSKSLVVDGPKICQFALQDHHRAVMNCKGLGIAIEQLNSIGNLPDGLLDDLKYINNNRVKVIHQKPIVRLLGSVTEYKNALLRVVMCLCPNWKIVHSNPGEESVQSKLDMANYRIRQLEAENAALRARVDSSNSDGGLGFRSGDDWNDDRGAWNGRPSSESYGAFNDRGSWGSVPNYYSPSDYNQGTWGGGGSRRYSDNYSLYGPPDILCAREEPRRRSTGDRRRSRDRDGYEDERANKRGRYNSPGYRT